MGNSCVTGACSQGSNGSGTTFKWRIDGFSALLDKDEGWTNSSVFVIKGLNWYLKLNPRDRKSGDQNEYVTLNLVLTKVSEKSHTVAETTFKFLIYDQLHGKHHEEHQVSHNFQATSRFSGTSCMIPLATLKEQPSGFLVNDSCVFGVQFIKVVAVKGKHVLETLFVQKTSNISNGPQAYTWNIDDFFVLKNPSTSPEFQLCGHKWFITIYPSGSDSNGNYISLHLSMKDTLHKDSGILAEVSISIKDQETGKHMKTSEFTVKFTPGSKITLLQLGARQGEPAWRPRAA
ncbi:probable inactive serine/threonine-protein kinase fnkC isoform X1 [Triticum dicoccoides]|uniref:probable inactive serine/threonine-protein kinase fnkC isoform X1 n=1 Tax=Triticum dicoccoides TaxID=85692 RepID=UPI000E794F5A|nr:probable inactive serine/threonine-protein kinase fnkC isoform X1 [Triticum dicoccoides]